MNQFAHTVPHSIFTERLVLRDLEENDFAAYYAIDLDPRVTPYVGTGEPETRSFETYRDEERERLSQGMGPHFHVWTVREKTSEKILGRVILRQMRNADKVEIGFRLAHAHWGQGYATEAVRAALEYGFNVAKFDEITALTHPDNKTSQLVLIRCGFVREATMKNHNGRELPFFRLPKARYALVSAKNS